MKFERTIALAAVGVLGAALIFSEYSRLTDRRANKEISNRLAIAEQTAQSALEAVIEPAVLRDAEKSVYMVMIDGAHAGSAFVIDHERGILATAAHVAELIDFTDEDTKPTILNRQSGKALRIRAAKIHAGYSLFRKLAEDYQPIDQDSRVLSPQAIRIYDLPHDGALLFVDPLDAATNENILGPALPIASDEKLASLSPGEPIALFGFPVDTITDNIEEDSAAVRVERGVIANMIAPIDLVKSAGDPATNTLIIHRMAMAPGHSGGPILNRDGEIVGINSHGNASYFSNGDNVAQRAEIIKELLSPYREQDMLERVYIPSWTARLKNWPKAIDVLPLVFYERDREREKPREIFEMKISDLDLEQDTDKLFRKKITTLEYDAFQRNFVMIANDLIPEEETEEGAEKEDDAQENRNRRIRSSSLKPTFEVNQRGNYKQVSEYLSKRRRHVVFAFDYSMAWGARGHCRTEIFYRREGDEEMRSTRPRYIASFFVETEEDKEKSSRFDVIIRGDRCDRQSDEFLYGVVSWEPKKDEEKEDSKSETATAFLNDVTVTLINAGRGAENAMNCHAPLIGAKENCEKLLKVKNLDRNAD